MTRWVEEGTARRTDGRVLTFQQAGVPHGGSAPKPGRSVADSADDVRAICAELGITRLGMRGGSGGGPHVLACAALLPDLVTAVAVLASAAPYPAEGLDWVAGSLGEEEAQIAKCAIDGDAVTEPFSCAQQNGRWHRDVVHGVSSCS
jgi:pimeloyl-ACP methyl ester carboxylesterase